MIASPVTDAEILAEVIGPDRPDMPPDVCALVPAASILGSSEDSACANWPIAITAESSAIRNAC